MNIKPIQRTVLFAMALCAGNAVCAMSLDDAIQAALQNENQLKLSGLTVNQAAAVLQQAKKRNGANINLAGQLAVERIDSSDAGNPFFQTDGLRHPRVLELQFDYPVYTSGRKRLGVEVAKAQLNAQSQAFSGQRATTILQTVQSYTDVLKQQALLGLRRGVVSNLNQSLSDSQKRFKAGVITRADLAQVQSQYAQAQADVVLAQSNLDISSAQFKQITGIDPEQLQTVRRIPVVPNQIDEVLQQVAQHPLLLKARSEQQAAEQQYRLVKRELTPTLNLTSRISKQNEINNFDSKSDNYLLGLQLNVPLFDQGLNRANRQKAQVDVSLAQEKISAVAQDLSKRAQSTYAQLQAVRQNKQALSEAIDAAALAYNFIEKELEFGSKTTFDALNAEQTLKDLQTQKLLNEQDEVVLVYQLLDQMGQLNNIAQPFADANGRSNESNSNNTNSDSTNRFDSGSFDNSGYGSVATAMPRQSAGQGVYVAPVVTRANGSATGQSRPTLRQTLSIKPTVPTTTTQPYSQQGISPKVTQSVVTQSNLSQSNLSQSTVPQSIKQASASNSATAASVNVQQELAALPSTTAVVTETVVAASVPAAMPPTAPAVTASSTKNGFWRKARDSMSHMVETVAEVTKPTSVAKTPAVVPYRPVISEQK